MTHRDPGIPIRSTRPDRRRTGRSAVVNSANLRLDEPPLIVRMQERLARWRAMRLDQAGISMLCRDMAIVRLVRMSLHVAGYYGRNRRNLTASGHFCRPESERFRARPPDRFETGSIPACSL